LLFIDSSDIFFQKIPRQAHHASLRISFFVKKNKTQNLIERLS